MERHIYDRMAEIDRDHWWFVGRRKIVAALIERFRPREGPMEILEVGAGTGSNIALLQNFGRVDAIEPDDAARDCASRRTGLAIKGGYLPDGVQLDDGRYDMIVLLDVLEHIPDDRAALAALPPKLAPGGRLLLTVPAIPALWSGHDLAHHHHRRYTRRTLDAVVCAAGFRPIHRSAFNSLLLPALVAVRSLRKLTGRQGGDDDTMPSPPINGLLARLFGGEAYFAARGLLPFGVSLALIAEVSPGPGGTTR